MARAVRPGGTWRDDLSDLEGLRVGQSESPDRDSGVTAVLFDEPAPTVLDVRGGASCTYDTESLALDATFGRRWAIFFSGGSVFGLDAARGIRTRILEAGGGHAAFRNPNPVVPISGACLFDLPRSRGGIPDYLPIGYAAASTATRDRIRQGRVGAGAGATVGKYRGRARAMPGGVGSASERVGRGGRVGILAVVNAIGAVQGPGGVGWIAGARGLHGRILSPDSGPPRARSISAARGTTLALAVVDATVERRILARIAGQVHAGLARAVRPVHSALDGDLVFAASTGRHAVPRAERRPGELADELGAAAGRCAERAVRRAVRPRAS